MRYLGLYKLTEDRKTSFFVVTENVLDPQRPDAEIYDLKGSLVGRQRREDSPSSPLLDQDLNRKLHMDGETRRLFLEQIQRDAEVGGFQRDSQTPFDSSQFLYSQNLMDYSLLVGITPLTNAPELGGSSSASQAGTRVAQSGAELISGMAVPGMVYFCEGRKKQRKKKPDILSVPVPEAPAPLTSCMKRKKRTPAGRALLSFKSESCISMSQSLPMRSISSPSISALSRGEGPAKSRAKQVSVVTSPNKEVYHMGVIDILQKYDSKKKIAAFAKSLKHNRVRSHFPFPVPI